MKIELIPERASELRQKALGQAEEQVLGADLFEEPFANIFLCARKKSGKTTVLYNILNHCAGKTTKVICFASTIYKDAQWLRIYDILKDKKIDVRRYVSMYDDKGKNVLRDTMEKLQQEAEQNIAMQEAMEKQQKDLEKRREWQRKHGKKQNMLHRKRLAGAAFDLSAHGVSFCHDNYGDLKNSLHDYKKKRRLAAPELNCVIMHDDVANQGIVGFVEDEEDDIAEYDYAFQSGSRMYKDRDIDIKQIEEERKKEDNGGYVVPEYIFVFDDLSNELRDPIIAHLLKTNRHYKSKVILSSQYVQDIPPSSRKQIDYWLLFAGHSADKLEVIHKDADTRLTFEQFVRVYRQVTSVPYQFLLLNTVEDEYRAGFGDSPLQVMNTDTSKLQDKEVNPAADNGDENDEDENDDNQTL